MYIFYIYAYSICVQIIYVDLKPFCVDSTYIEISLEHLIFQAVLHGPWPRRNCNCVDSKFSALFKDILYQEDILSYVNPQSWISHFGFLSSSAMERREDSLQRMLGSWPSMHSQFVGLCAEL